MPKRPFDKLGTKKRLYSSLIVHDYAVDVLRVDPDHR